MLEANLLYVKLREHYSLPVAKAKMGDVIRHNEDMLTLDVHSPVVVVPSAQWTSLQSEANYTKLLQSKGLVEPREILLDVGDGGQRHEMCYLPPLKTIQQYLSHPDVFRAVRLQNSETHNEDKLHDFVDGEYFKTYRFFAGDRSLLRIHLYCDELEVCNPLGSSKAKRKLTCFYFLLGNLPGRYLSSLRNIFLLAVVQSVSVKMFEYDVVLS